MKTGRSFRLGFWLAGWVLVGMVFAAAAQHVRRQSVDPPEVAQLARAVDEHYNHLRSLESDFTEIYRGEGAERVESGTLWLKKPRKMRWEYRSPKEKLFISDGEAVWFYLPKERQLERRRCESWTICGRRWHFCSVRPSWRMNCGTFQGCGPNASGRR